MRRHVFGNLLRRCVPKLPLGRSPSGDAAHIVLDRGCGERLAVDVAAVGIEFNGEDALAAEGLTREGVVEAADAREQVEELEGWGHAGSVWTGKGQIDVAPSLSHHAKRQQCSYRGLPEP